MDLREAVERYKTDCEPPNCDDCPLGKVISTGPEDSVPLEPPRKICELFDFISQNLGKKEPLCRLGHCVKKGRHYGGGDSTVFNKLLNGICPICGGAIDRKYPRPR